MHHLLFYPSDESKWGERSLPSSSKAYPLIRLNERSKLPYQILFRQSGLDHKLPIGGGQETVEEILVVDDDR
jgi:hypothetical protein